MNPVTTVGTRCNHVVTRRSDVYDGAQTCKQCGATIVTGGGRE